MQSNEIRFRRRDWLRVASAFAAGAFPVSIAAETRVDSAEQTTARTEGLLMGSLIGDALGGPIEFLHGDVLRGVMPNTRGWPDDRRIDVQTRRELADSLVMHGYEKLRPETAPYGPWIDKAPRGTITDDSRHKIVLLRAIRRMLDEGRRRLDEKDLARQFIDFRPRVDRAPGADLQSLVDEGLREYRFASHWVLGRRDKRALPPERLWSGISNCSGQMALLPLAALFPGQPEVAYRETFAIDFIDAPMAKDMVASLNAGLAAALDPKLDSANDAERWDAFFDALQGTDPYRLADVPFAGRPLTRWLDLADSIAKRGQGNPAELFRLLETEGKPVYFWDAHFTLLVPLTLLKSCRLDPLPAIHLTLDFGHDTDSYAQVLGAIVGAVHGIELFDPSMRSAVSERLEMDYGESVSRWASTLADARKVWQTAWNTSPTGTEAEPR